MEPARLTLLLLAATLAAGCGADPKTAADTLAPADTADTADVADTVPTADTAVAPPAPLAPPGPGFHTAGPWIQDAAGRTVLLHGANVSQSTKYTPDRLPWQGPEDFESLAATGLNSVRLLVHWAAIMPTEGDIDSAWLDALAERVDWAADAGLVVIIDMHQDVFGEGFGDNGAPLWACDHAYYDAYEPTSPWFLNYLSPQVAACFDHLYSDDALFTRFVDAWTAVAARLADHPAVVGFDLLNEPHQGTADLTDFVPDVWQPRQEQLAAALRAVAPGRVVFFGAPPYQSLGLVAEFTPTPSPDVAFAPHYYHPGVHDGGEYQVSYGDDIDHALDAMAESAALLGGAAPGVPTWVGEMGGPTAIDSMDLYLGALVTRLATRGWGYAWYSDDKGSDFGLRDADGAFLPEIIALLAHPYARRVPGPLVATDLALDARRYRATFTWDYDAAIELWVGPGTPQSVTVAPASDPSARVPCAQADDAPRGVWSCPPATATRWGDDYAITLEWTAH